MSKPLNKGGTEKPPIPTIKIPPRNQYQTRAATQAANSIKATSIQSGNPGAQPKKVQGNKGKAAGSSKEEVPITNKQELTMLQTIAKAINIIIEDTKPEKKVRSLLEDLVKFISNMEEKEKERAERSIRQLKVSTLHKAIRQDLSKVHEALTKKIDSALGTASVTLETTKKTLLGI